MSTPDGGPVRIGARLQHTHVIGMFDVVIHKDRPWLVMEYLPSESLAALIALHGPRCLACSWACSSWRVRASPSGSRVDPAASRPRRSQPHGDGRGPTATSSAATSPLPSPAPTSSPPPSPTLNTAPAPRTDPVTFVQRYYALLKHGFPADAAISGRRAPLARHLPSAVPSRRRRRGGSRPRHRRGPGAAVRTAFEIRPGTVVIDLTDVAFLA